MSSCHSPWRRNIRKRTGNGNGSMVSRAGYDPRTVQELLGHQDLNTTMVYLYGLNRGGLGVRSPLERL